MLEMILYLLIFIPIDIYWFEVTEWKSQKTTLAYISTPRALATLSNLRHPSQPPFSIVAILASAAGNIVVGDVDCRRTQLVAAKTQLLPAADARGVIRILRKRVIETDRNIGKPNVWNSFPNRLTTMSIKQIKHLA